MGFTDQHILNLENASAALCDVLTGLTREAIAEGRQEDAKAHFQTHMDVLQATVRENYSALARIIDEWHRENPPHLHCHDWLCDCELSDTPSIDATSTREGW